MDIIQAIILGIAQGLTEFLPISSSAHLVIIPNLIGANSNLAFDTLLHLGTLVAVIGYFWNDVIAMIKAFISSIADIKRGAFQEGMERNPMKKLVWLVLLGSVPAAVLGILLKNEFESLFNSLFAVGFFLIITAIILWTSEQLKSGDKKIPDFSFKNSLFIGLFQGLAIAPGISRSGATISAGLFSGLNRKLAARYSFLLSIPAILGATLIQAKDIIEFDSNFIVLIVGFISAALSGYLAIKFLMNYIQKHSLKIFAYYCLIVGLMILIYELLIM